MRYLEQSNSWRQKVESWLAGAGWQGDNGELFNGYRVLVWEDKDVREWFRKLHNNMNVFNDTELYG